MSLNDLIRHNTTFDNTYDFEKYDLDNFYKYCPNYSYIPTIISPKKRIIVIGDLHGDLDLTIRCLRLAKVIDKDGAWIGGKTVVVQTGDKIDGCRPIPNVNSCSNQGNEAALTSGVASLMREDLSSDNLSSDSENLSSLSDASYNAYNADDDIKILELFYDLHKKAEKQGGAVYSLLGNHELMNVEGNLKYVSKRALEEFADYNDGKISFKDKFSHLSKLDRGIVARKYAFSPGNKWSTFLACTNIGCIIIGSFLFVHAGIVPQFIKELGIKNNKDLVKINHLVRLWLLNLIKKDEIYKIISGESSIFWDRILASMPSNDSDEKCKKNLDPVLKLFNVGNMVIGHTPQFLKGINSSCSNKLWKIDIGASKAFKNFDKYVKNEEINKNLRDAQVLEILDDQHINVLK